MLIKRINHPINTHTRISSNYYGRSMLWFSNNYISERNRNGGYVLFNRDMEHVQISSLSGMDKYIEDLESDLTGFNHGSSVITIASFYDEQTDRLEFEDDKI